jgi:XTP/dITP diphosphohydrolase
VEIWFATFNKGKINEFRNLSEGLPLDLHLASEISTYASPVENANTFEGNARIKAKSLKALKTESWVLAEDSGLEVDGLDNKPGVFSARYAGDNASDMENVAKVMKMLKIRSPKNRTARFVCCLVAISPDGDENVFHGTVEGEISAKVAGQTGFGYDPIFYTRG